MKWPQITLIIIWAISIGILMPKHGQPRTGNHNFFVLVIALAVEVILLYYGGFWT